MSGEFDDTVRHLAHGDFSHLEPLFRSGRIVEWFDRFDAATLAEALSCAAFLGCTNIVKMLLDRGVDPAAGNATGLDALHWAADRGQLGAVRLLIRHGAPLESRSRYGGTVLGTAIWSTFHEPRHDHLRIIQELIAAGARVEEVAYPTGNPMIDAMLKRMTARIHLTFAGECEAAFRYYEQHLGGKIQMLLTFGASPARDEVPPEWHGKIVHGTIFVGDHELAGADALPADYQRPQGFYVLLHVDARAEAERIFAALSDGGDVRMPLQKTFWSPAFGVVVDRFGVPWEISCAPPPEAE